jgi:hypothetical protein
MSSDLVLVTGVCPSQQHAPPTNTGPMLLNSATTGRFTVRFTVLSKQSVAAVRQVQRTSP